MMAPERGSGSDGSVGTVEDDTDAGRAVNRTSHSAGFVRSRDGTVKEVVGGADTAQRLVAARAVLGEAPGVARVQRFDSADYMLADSSSAEIPSVLANSAEADARACDYAPATTDAHDARRVLAHRAINGGAVEEPGRIRRFDSADHVMNSHLANTKAGSGEKAGPVEKVVADGQVLLASRAVAEPPGRLRRFDSADFYKGQASTRQSEDSGDMQVARASAQGDPDVGSDGARDGKREVAKHALGRLGLL
mmetsp:Transcript_17366/g.31632  ORF Transcript_17366/g.31632 Transcript_17366/m.31632 type:complete len:250 (+) Transcript_17366:153-902(+)